MRGRGGLLRTALLASTALCAAGLPDAAVAADAAWSGNTSSDYNDNANWIPGGPPDGVASFISTTGSKAPTITASTSAARWEFAATGENWAFSNQSTFSFTGTGISILTGTVTITNQTAATLNFNGSSSAGGATINLTGSGGIGSFLRFNGTSTAANATINTVNDETFVAIEGNASGGSARFILNNFGTGTAGTLHISTLTSAGTTAGSIEGSGNVALGSKNLEVGSLGTSTELSGIVSGLGGGSLTKVGGGTLTLSGANIYDGGTTISAGALQIGNGSTSGSLTGDVVNNALLIFNRSNALTFGGTISGTGAVRQDGGGTLTLSAVDTYSGATTITNGTVALSGAGSIAQSSGVNITNAAGSFDISGTTSGASIQTLAGVANSTVALGARTLTLTNASTNFAGTIGGTGGLIVAGTQTLSGANTYSGGTTINNGGTLHLGNGGTTGSIGGNVTNNGTLSFNRSDDIAFGGNISGTGGLTKTGAGTLTLSGTNTYAGATAINGGTLAITADANLGNGGDIALNGGTLRFANPLTSSTFLTLARDVVLNAGGGTFDTPGLLVLPFFSVTATVNGSISGSGGLIKNGTGHLTITGPASYTGDTTVNSGALNLFSSTPQTLSGTITVSNNDPSGFAALNMQNMSFAPGTTLTLTTPDGFQFPSQIQSFGGNSFSNTTINIVGSKSEFSANEPSDTLGNAVVTNSGSLAFSAATSAQITNNAGGLVSGRNLGSSFVDNRPGGQLRLTQSLGNSTIINASAAPLAFAFNVPAGMWWVGTSSNAGNATITNLAGGVILFTEGDAGNVTFNNNSGATLNFQNNLPNLIGFSLTAGNATINNAGLVTFNGGVQPLGTNTAGNATFNNSGMVTFNGTTTASSATIDNSGLVTFNGGASTGNANITSTGTIALNTTDTAGAATVTLNSGGLLTGTGAVGNTTANAGATVAPASLIFNGSLTLNGGTLQAGTAFNPTITGAFTLGAGGGTFDSNGFDASVASSIGGAGALTKAGTGTLTLSGNNTYTGATNVNAGGLIVNGSIASSSVLNVNGSLVGGTGTLPNTIVNNGGALSPGNSVGAISVQGNLTFNAGGTYAVEFSSTAADRANVAGIATLGGATVQAIALPGSFRAQTYTILNAASIVGTFGSVVLNGRIPGARNPHLTYDANNVFLVLDPGTIQLPDGTSGHAANVASGVNNAILNGGLPPAAFDVLLNLSGSSLNSALNQISGPAPTGAALGAMQMMNSFLALALNPYGGAPDANPGALSYARAFGAAADNPLPKEAADAYAAIMPVKVQPASFGSRWSVWGQGYGGYNKTDGDAAAGTADTTARTWGFAAGADHRITPNTTLGFALAGGELNWNLAQGLGGGKSDVFQAGLYGSHRFGAAYISGAVAYAWYDMKTDRTVTVAGTDMLRADFNAHSFGGRLEAGYRFATPHVGVTPYVAGQVQTFRTPGYSETAIAGAGTFALSYSARDTTATRFELGSWFDKLIAMNNGHALLLRGRAAWAHDEGNTGGISAVFQTLPGSNFTVNGAAPPKDLALISAGGELRLRNGISLGARFDGEFAGRAQTYAGTGTARYTW